MLIFSETAVSRIKHFLQVQAAQGVSALRVAGNAADAKLWLVKDSDLKQQDIEFEVEGIRVFMDSNSSKALEGAQVDFIQDMMRSGFRVYFPSPTWDDAICQGIQDVIDKRINPDIASHGGRVRLEGRKDDTAFIRFEGGCQGCAASSQTLKQGVEVLIKDNVAAIHNVVDVTDHAAGENPYFREDTGVGQSAFA